MSSIIHFTKKYDSLKSILSESSFRLKYCREELYSENTISSRAVHPMVSFSEQIIKTIHKKTITYGLFGIGLKKSWVKKWKLHPVLYIDKNSQIASALAILLKARRKKAKTELAPHVRLSIIVIKCFTKNSFGYNSYFRIKDFNFKAEKEWRFVPTKSQINDNLISQTKARYEEKPDYYNNKLKESPLTFNLSDIEYVFVKTEKQRQEISDEFGIEKKIIKISNWTTSLKK